MPLTAKDASGNRVYSIDFDSAHEIRDTYKSGSLQCRFCDETVFPRQRGNSIVHFFHKRKCSTQLEHHPESIEHLMGKAALADHLGKQTRKYNTQIVIEYPIPQVGEHGRIADVAALYPNGYVLIYECQLASITTNELERRTNDYEEAGFDIEWWFGKAADIQANNNWAMSKYSATQKLQFHQHSESFSLSSGDETEDNITTESDDRKAT